MPMSDSEKQQAVSFVKKAEAILQKMKGPAGGLSDSEHYDLLRHILNACKRLAGDQAPLVE